MLKYCIALLLLCNWWTANAQTGDSVPATADTARRIRPTPPKPTVRRAVAAPATVQDTLPAKDTILPPYRTDTVYAAQAQDWHTPTHIYNHHPYYRFTNATKYTVSVRQWQGKEPIFYSLIALLIFFAVIRNGFGRYISDLGITFFRTSVRQRQIKDQLLQNPLPSLLLNIFFVLSIGMFAALVLQHYGLGLQFNFWLLYVYCVIALAGIYLVKFVLLKFMGWVLGASDAADTYIFVIFSTNKIMGIALLPVLLVLGFNQGTISQVVVTLGLFIIVGLFAYRFFLSYISIHRQVQVRFFHFLIYLAAFEIVPLLLINKLLFRFLS